jgi:hypothetical protein
MRDTVQAYFGAWNRRDGREVQALLGEAALPDPGPEALSAFLPDYRFEVVSVTVEGERAAAGWVLRGTHTAGLKPGIEATGRAVELHGVDILEGSPRLSRATRHFDRMALYEQLGLQVIVQPFEQGPATFGYSKRVASGNPAPPAVVGLTWIRFRGAAELDRIRSHSAGIIEDFLAEPGFISIVTGAAAGRAFTVTAWESEEALERALAKGHLEAKRELRTTGLSPAVWTSVWTPLRLNRLWTRCPSCEYLNADAAKGTVCGRCASPLPDPELYW